MPTVRLYRSANPGATHFFWFQLGYVLFFGFSTILRVKASPIVQKDRVLMRFDTVKSERSCYFQAARPKHARLRERCAYVAARL
jgi:hypothetical protein